MLFLLIVAGFIFSFIITADPASSATESLGGLLNNKPFASFLTGTVRLAIALGLAALVAYIITRLGFVNKRMVKSAYIAPVENFFSRYGASLAILILSLVGLYRISDFQCFLSGPGFYQKRDCLRRENIRSCYDHCRRFSWRYFILYYWHPRATT